MTTSANSSSGVGSALTMIVGTPARTAASDVGRRIDDE